MNAHLTRLAPNGARARLLACLSLAAAGTLGSLDAGAALQPLADVTMVSAGEAHACAVTSSGGVKCWGENLRGQLGDNSRTSRSTAVNVHGLATGITAVAAGTHHTCALTTAGGVKCWGGNDRGQIGDGSTINRLMAVDVPGLASGVSAITAGAFHTCALTTGGAVKCWGANYYGQLGDNTLSNRLTPVDVAGLAGIAAISGGAYHTCALTAGGGAKCWGFNDKGEIGDGSLTMRPAPVDVAGLASGVTAIAAGHAHTCAIVTGGAAKCWGNNFSGQLGDNSTTERVTPVDVAGLASGVTAIAVGNAHTCALVAGGAAKCWGLNAAGQLGDNSTTSRSAAVDVTGLSSGVSAITAGGQHTCALTEGGAVKCWGLATSGQLGDDYAKNRLVPRDVTGLAGGVTAMAAGSQHTCALTAGGGVKCWGQNSHGQLGDGSTTDRPTPVDVAGLTSGVVAITAGFSHTCAVTSGGGVKCWGENYRGQLGDNSTTTRLVPVNVAGLDTGISSVAAGGHHTCALTTGGGVKCWGGNGSGALGDGSTTQSQTPVDVAGLASGVMAIAAGGFHTCAITTGGGAKCWGSNSSGELGNNSNVVMNHSTPVDVWDLATGVASIAAGSSRTCALTLAGGVKCWGAGTLGSDFMWSPTSNKPLDVAGLSSGVAAIAAGYYHRCVVMAGGAAKCWGSNGEGQLGDNSTTNRLAPVDVAGLSAGVAGVAAGGSHTCAFTTGGAAMCWGSNWAGKLGDGSADYRPDPTDVLVATVGLSVAKDGAGSGSVSSSPPGIDCGATCSLGFGEPVVTLAATAAGGSIFTGWSGAGCSGTGTCTVTLTDATSVTASFVPQAGALALAANPASVDFGWQSMGTTSPVQAITITNIGNGPVSVSGTAVSDAQFVQTNDCAMLAIGASCTVHLAFSPPVTIDTPAGNTSVSGNLSVASDAVASPLDVPLAGLAEKSLVSHYYRAILRRAPDAGGRGFWEAEIVRMHALGVDRNEAWLAMAVAFFSSAEYAALGRDSTGFVTDLYTTFFNRSPDPSGLAYWTGQLVAGMPPGIALASFMLSPEFVSFTQGIWGDTAARAEVDTVVDFYRGLLGRLPDSDGFNYWVGRFRTAQCQNAGAVYAQVESISASFLYSYEYAARDPSNAQYVSDLYNAFLRRGGELTGVQYWIDQLASFNMSREDVRQQFIASPEFQARVNAIIAQGCLP